jgi:hypothetical protein
MRRPEQPRQPFPNVPAEVLEKAYHPFDKLVIGLPPAMVRWVQAYGPAADWKSLPANPLMESVRRRNEVGSRDTPLTSSDVPRPPSVGTRSGDAEAPSRQPSARPAAARVLRCDTCDRDFATEEKYEAHMKTHIYCTVPGCRFTCRENRAHLMQEHMDALHNRPDAPNLVDTSAYLEQRKRRFPTQEVIKDKVEELYYKAARGVVLPDERRRWMRQHGIDVGKRPRTEASYIARGRLPEKSRSPSAPSDASDGESDKTSSSSQPRGDGDRHDSLPTRCPLHEIPQSPQSLPPSQNARAEAAHPRFIQPPVAPVAGSQEDPTAPPPIVPPAAAAVPDQPRVASSSSPTVSSSRQRPASAASAGPHPIKIIPLGPNGTLTPRQRVQLVRERYASAKEVPQFYVCHRCGRKGEHWVDDCPTKGDATYNRHVVWGEAKMEAGEGRPKATTGPRERTNRSCDEQMEEGQQEGRSPNADGTRAEKIMEEARMGEGGMGAQPQVVPQPTHEGALAPPLPHDNASSSGINANDDDDAPPVPQSAAPPVDAAKEVTRVMAPVAAAKYAQPNRRDPLRRPPPPPTLYQRLTEEEHLNEQGVLLQAMRFFTAREFFQEKK